MIIFKIVGAIYIIILFLCFVVGAAILVCSVSDKWDDIGENLVRIGVVLILGLGLGVVLLNGFFKEYL